MLSADELGPVEKRKKKKSLWADRLQYPVRWA